MSEVHFGGSNVGFTIGNLHTFNDFGLRCTSFSITPPEPQRSIMSVPGRNGAIDASLPEVSESFQQRQMEIYLDSHDSNYQSWASALSAVMNAFHGKRLDIIPDFDDGWKYSGWISVSSVKEDKYGSDIILTVNCDPYKHKTTVTVVQKTITTDLTFTVTNTREPVEPKLTTSAAISLKIGNTTYIFASGTYAKAGFMLPEGSTSIKITGASTVTIEYTEGSL